MSFRRRSARALIGRRWARSPHHDTGSAAVELVVLAPAIVVLVLAVVFLGRAGQSSQQVRHAADRAARAASQVSVSHMAATARSAALADLAGNGVGCARAAVVTAIETAADGAPRSVTVTVTCAVEHQGLELLGTRPRHVQASSTETVDRHRAP